MLSRNVGGLDQIGRMLVGACMAAIGFFFPAIIGDQLFSLILGVIGIGFFLSGILQFCPLYSLAGINTKVKKE